MSRVEVTAYDPEWPRTFDRIRAHVWPAVQHAAMSLEHVGSTSVPGLRAKPAIDACIVVASRRDIPHVVKALTKIDYAHLGDLGVVDREAFKQPESLPKHHLYASPRGSLSLKNHLGLRDYLRAHSEAAIEYGDLKENLARQYPDDIDRYIAGKTEFILGILRKIGLTDEELAVIRGANQIDNHTRPIAHITRDSLHRPGRRRSTGR
jgi:GrpB-like predicted nucleotidyltransferase (UPF0157 family)